jgi:hypothetical protein
MVVIGVTVWALLFFVPVAHVPAPLPLNIWPLAFFLPGIWFLSSALVRRCFPEKDRSAFIPGVALGLWVMSVHFAALFAQRFYPGLIIATCGLGIAGYFVKSRIRRTAAKKSERFPRSLWIGASIGTALLLPEVVLMDIYDKLAVLTGHFSITEEIVNGIYPPRHMSIAREVLPYHYAVDTLFAMVKAVFRLRTDIAIDLVTIVLWFYVLFLFGSIGIRLFGKKVGGYAALLGAFAGGLPWIGAIGNPETPRLFAQRVWFSEFSFAGYRLAYHLTANWFQHPWTLGVPMCLTLFLVLLHMYVNPKGSLWRYVVVFVLLVTLGLSQTALYLGVVASLAAYGALRFVGSFFGPRKTRTDRLLLYSQLVLVTLLAVCTCAFFADNTKIISGAMQGTIVPLKGIIGGTWLRWFQWNAASFGLLVPLMCVGLFRAKTFHLALFSVFMAIGGITIVNSYRFVHTWDIIKFAQVASLAMSIYAGGFVASLLTHRGRIMKLVGIPLAVFLVAGSVSHSAMITFEGMDPQAIRVFGPQVALWRQFPQRMIPKDFIDAAAWLRTQVKAGDIVLTPASRTMDMAVLAGIPVLEADEWQARAFGFSMSEVQFHRSLYSNPFLFMPKSFYDNGVRWLVTGTDHPSMESLAEKWLKLRSLELVGTFGTQRVFRLLPSS